MPPVPNRRASPACSPRIRKSTASSSQGYGTGAMKALQNADRPMVPIVAAAFNGTGVACAQTKGAKCWLGANPPSLSAEAIKLAVDMLEHRQEARPTRPCCSTRPA